MRSARSAFCVAPGGLAALSVREFVALVGSVAEPVPAGGSVAALAGAASAALVVLVCGVLRRRRGAPPDIAAYESRARDLQDRLLQLVDEDAAAFRAFIDQRGAADSIARVTQTPLEIASACSDVVRLCDDVEAFASEPVMGDVRVARHLARAAVAAALDIAEQNVGLRAAEDDRAVLRAEIARLRTYG